MNKFAKKLSLISTSSLIFVMPCFAISCVSLTPKQKEVKSKYNKLAKILEEKIKNATNPATKAIYEQVLEGINSNYKKSDEDYAKLSDIECDAHILALDALLKVYDK